MEPLPKLTEGRSVISSYPDLLSTLTDFLTVCIHTILYHRNIYPPELYIKARKYSFPVYQSRHERVCKWIADAVGAVAGEIAKVWLDLVLLGFPVSKLISGGGEIRAMYQKSA